MGLALTLPAQNNHIGHTFTDAYWVIEDLRYEMQPDGLYLLFWLNCYPTREASKLTGQVVTSLSIGSPKEVIFNAKLYEYTGLCLSTDVFPQGIPVSPDEQKTAIYNWVKAFTGLPFKDVFEPEIEQED